MSNDSMTTGVSSTELSGAVLAIKTAILQSQGRAARGVNQEQLALYYGIGRFISVNTRKRNWGTGAIDGISERLKGEMPGLRGFSGRNLKNMRAFYEAWSSQGKGFYGGGAINEKGVMLSATVTGRTNDKAKEANPFVAIEDGGYGESNLPDIMIGNAATAREAVKILGEKIAEKGHSGPEIYMVADSNETWYIEVYTGRQWAAVRMPEDKVAVFGNQFNIRFFKTNETQNVMYSPNLVRLASDKDFVVWAELVGLINQVSIPDEVTVIGDNLWEGLAEGVVINGETIKRRKEIAAGFPAESPSGAISPAEFERIDIVDGKAHLGVSVWTNSKVRVSGEGEGWGVATNGVIEVPAPGKQGFFYLRSKSAK